MRFSLFLLLFYTNLTHAKGFGDYRNGLITVAENHLYPLLYAVAACFAIYYAIMCIIDADQYKRKLASTIGYSALGAVIIEVVEQVIHSFGGRAL